MKALALIIGIILGVMADITPLPESVRAMISQDEVTFLNDVLGDPLSEEELKAASLVVETVNTQNYSLQNSELFEGDILIEEEDRNAIKAYWKRWPKAEIPYVISVWFNDNERKQIARAMNQYHEATCIRFRHKMASDEGFIHIFKGSGCYSTIGRTGREQKVSLGSGCVNPGIAVHEFMHAAGFWHEQSRIDRDKFVRINHQNIRSGMESNFKKYESHEAEDLNAPYDVCSIMHYGKTAFSKNGVLQTITVLTPGKCSIGQRNTFSDIDVKKLNTLYKCAGYPQIGGTSSNFKCEDKYTDCQELAERGDCKTVEWMNRSCKVSCNTCTPKVTTTTPIVITDCNDKYDDCPELAKRGDCNTVEWMKRSCKVSCKICTPKVTTTTPTVTTDCNDKYDDCPKLAKRGDCNTVEWMKRSCKISCNTCTPKLTTTTPTPTTTTSSKTKCIKDLNESCQLWVSKGYCTSQQYMQYMEDNCPITCKVLVDQKNSCEEWATGGYCTKGTTSERKYMAANCAKSCNDVICRIPCKDQNENCKVWASNGYCATTKNKQWMKENCSKSCQVC